MIIKKETINDYDFITIRNRHDFKVTLCTFGASIFSIDFAGKSMNSHPLSKEVFSSLHCYHGKSLGRVAGRIKSGEYSINNKTYKLDKNEGKNTLHGGVNNLSFARFFYETKQEKDEFHLYFSYFSKKGECGFNGNVNIIIEYIMYEDKNDIDIAYHAKSDEDTILNLSNHLYFNLGLTDILNLKLKINSHLVSKLDDELIPLDFVNVNQIFDFSKPRCIGDFIDSNELIAKKLNGYDHIYKFQDSKFDDIKAILSNSEFTMYGYSTYDSAIFYANGFPLVNITMNDGKIDSVHKSITAEFMNSSPIILKANNEYLQKTRYSFKQNKL